jgi:sugar phosphate permease
MATQAAKPQSDELEFARPDTHISNWHPEHRQKVEKSLKRKLNARCSVFVLIYIMNYLDRNNIAAARLKGLEADLGLTKTQYSTCLSICMMKNSSKSIETYADRLSSIRRLHPDAST